MKFFKNVFGVTTLQKITAWHSCWEIFWVISGLILLYVPIFLEDRSIFSHEILYRCSWYTLTVTTLIHAISTWGSFWCVFLYLLRIVQYFLMKFCIDVCSTNMMVTALKYFIHIIYFSAGSHFGEFWTNCFSVCSSISWISVILYRYFWYYSGNHSTKKGFSHHFSFSARGHFAAFWGPFWKLSHDVLYGCSWVILFQMVQNFWDFDMTHSRNWYELAELL